MSKTKFSDTLLFHVRYELVQLNRMYELLADPRWTARTPADWPARQRDTAQETLDNALTEAFSIHARGLIEFLRGTNKQSDGTKASWFTRDGIFVPLHINERWKTIGPIYRNISKQIAHVSIDRVKLQRAKLGRSNAWRCEVSFTPT